MMKDTQGNTTENRLKSTYLMLNNSFYCQKENGLEMKQRAKQTLLGCPVG